MRVGRPTIRIDEHGARTSVTITADAGFSIEPWYQLPPGWPIDQTPAPFVPVAVALATVFEEDVVLDEPISGRLLAGAAAAGPLFAAYHGRRSPQVHGDARSPSPRGDEPRHVGLFLSRGVDSSANLLLGERGDLDPKPTLAIVMAGIEPANTPEVDALVVRRSIDAAREFGLEAVVPSTNLRYLLDPLIGWIDVFGCVLAGAALAMSRRLDHAIISSAGPTQTMLLGAHPDLDPLWGTEWIDFHHLPLALSRPERLRLLVDDGRALHFLKVCSMGAVDNCGRCQKCIQTAALLEVLGALDRCTTFPMDAIDVEDLRTRPTSTVTTPDFVAAAQATHPDFADAVGRDRGRDTALGALRPSTTRLNEAARAVGDDDRPLAWCAIGAPSEALAAAVDAARTALGPGTVWLSTDPLPRPVLDRLLTTARVTMWSGPDDRVDLDRVVEVLASGGRPLQITAPASAARLRARLPEPLGDVVGTVADVAARGATDEASRRRLAGAVVGGGASWLATVTASPIAERSPI